MPGEEETKVGSSAHLAASAVTSTTTTTTTWTTIATTATSSSATIVPSGSSSVKSGSSSGVSGVGLTNKCNSSNNKGAVVHVNPNRLSQVSLKKSEDGSVCLVEGTTDEEEDGSKMELELQFAGIDNETVELDLDEEDNNVDQGGERGGGSASGGSGGSRGGSAGPRSGPTTTMGSGGGLVATTTTANAVDEEEDEDVEGGKTGECTEVIVPIQTLAEKCLFYITAFFILLAVFSLFAFLFLVPFVIDPAFTTIFMEFDPEPAFCLTVSNVALEGLSNCNWTSCREGCTREIFSCKQIRVNYRRANRNGGEGSGGGVGTLPPSSKSKNHHHQQNSNHLTNSNSNKYADPGRSAPTSSSGSNKKKTKHKSSTSSELTRSGGGGSVVDEWDYRGAHLFPNVKGCGYPPVVVCSDFYEKYGTEGTNFSCYYSKVDRGLVVTTYNMRRVIFDLIYSMAIPIPSFIISVVYLIFAYFRLYNTDSSSSAPRGQSIPLVNQSSTNNNIQAGTSTTGEPDGETSLSGDDKSKMHKSTSRGLNALDKSAKSNHSQVIEMNDLNPQIHNPADGDLLLPRRNNRAPERNGPANPAAKNKGENKEGGGNLRPETEKYLEPGVLPEKNNTLPPIDLAPSLSSSTKKLEGDEDNTYMNSKWADSSSLKRSFQGLGDVSWKPK